MARQNKKKRQARALKKKLYGKEDPMQVALKWKAYSTYHPSWNMGKVMADYKKGVPIDTGRN